MADFCNQCAEYYFDAAEGDLAGLGNGIPLEPGMGWSAICEGCGFIVVDDEGNCISQDCEEHGTVKREPSLTLTIDKGL